MQVLLDVSSRKCFGFILKKKNPKKNPGVGSLNMEKNRLLHQSYYEYNQSNVNLGLLVCIGLNLSQAPSHMLPLCFPHQAILNSDETTHVLENLDPDTPYDVSVTAIYPDESESEDLLGTERTCKMHTQQLCDDDFTITFDNTVSLKLLNRIFVGS